jgi:hypothetical protein
MPPPPQTPLSTTAQVVLDYVPKLKVRYNKDRMKSTLGPQAMTGYVVMCLDGMGVSDDETMSRTASYMVVMSMEGEVMSVRPMPGYDAMGIQPLQVRHPSLCCAVRCSRLAPAQRG